MARPYKGDRKARTIRFPLPLNNTIEKAAAAAGYADNIGDYVVAVVDAAIAAGIHPQPAVAQQRLPMSA